MDLNLEGSYLLHAAIEQTGFDYRGSTYGGLVLHIANKTTFNKVEQVINAALHLIDDETRKKVFEFIDQTNSNSTNSEFWKASPDEMIKKSGLYALEIWRGKGFESNKEEFRNLQNLLFDSILFNFVMTIQGSNQSRAFVKKSIGQGILGRLFGG